MDNDKSMIILSFNIRKYELNDFQLDDDAWSFHDPDVEFNWYAFFFLRYHQSYVTGRREIRFRIIQIILTF